MMETINWFKRELKTYTNCWNYEGELMLIRIASENNYSKDECKELIADALWYCAEDLMRIHG
jgi:hypothetical protein